MDGPPGHAAPNRGDPGSASLAPGGRRPRQQVAEALTAELPEVWEDLIAAGAEPAILQAATSDGPDRMIGFRCRRLTFERILRAAAETEPGVQLRIGHVDEICHEGGRARGVRVDGRQVAADLVIDASGRAGRIARAFRAAAEGGDSGIAYVSRQYQLLPGVEVGPTNTPIGMVVGYPGYLVIVFVHDNRTFSVLIARASTDPELAALRHDAAFEAALRAIPALAAWTDPERSQPITDVLPGGRLYNSYRGQLDDAARVAVDGLISVGDAVCTTNPAAGRGVATSLLQAQQLVSLLDEHRRDFTSCSLAFDGWCLENIKPWFDDHVYSDADLIRRWSGQDVDLSRRLPSDLIVAATDADPAMMKVVGPYLAMLALPDTLSTVENRAREVYAGGWRPQAPPGHSRDELAGLVTAAVAAQ